MENYYRFSIIHPLVKIKERVNNKLLFTRS